ncbi:MAG: heparan-alpha-glucosaminide N-acetyltransferase domain-containing protein [Thermoplasmatota archaeon]
MRRFASIDFMRGFAIFMMVVFHVIMRWYDGEWIKEGDLEGVPMVGLVFFMIVVYFSAWAGFFLMVSSIGNMISMHRNLERGKSWKKVMMFQIVGGLLLLAAAVLVESTIGYHAFFGYAVEGKLDKWTTILYRGFHMETIHTIALCVIVNGIVQGLLSRKGGHLKVRRNIRIYAVLAAISVALTGPVYKFLRVLVPGYPMAKWNSSIAGELDVQYPVIGESGIGDILLKTVMFPLGGNPEPLFPFLAIAFIGSIIGLYLCRKDCPRKMPRNGILAGVGFAVIGLVGTGVVLALGYADVETLMDNFYQPPGLYPSLWFWWFLFLMGGQLALVLLIIRMVEFRGKGKEFGNRTLSIRRYGYVAFSIYTYQFIYVLPRALMGIFPNVSNNWPYPERIGWWLPVLVMMPMTILLWEIVLRAWEKIEYVGGMEWMMAKVAEKLLPGRREGGAKKRRWWQAARLDAKEYLFKPEWMNIVDRKDVDHVGKEESKLALSLSLGGLFFLPLSLGGLWIGRSSMREEGRNWQNTGAVAVSLITMGLYAALIAALCFMEAPSF